MKNHPAVQERMKRQDGYYWVQFSKELQNSGFTNQWVIARWGGTYFWLHGDDYSADCFSEIDETPITRNTLLDRFTDRHTRIDEMIRNALGHSVCALIDSMSLDESKTWLADNGYELLQAAGVTVLAHNGVTIGEVRV